MTIQEEYELSCYHDLTRIKENKNVYLVKNIETGRICVRKKVDIYNKSVYLKLMNMNFQGIPQIHFCAEKDGSLIVIEDYVQGRSLQEICENEGLFLEKQVADIMCALCKILQQLHQCIPSIIHRDIKPSNIMLSDDGMIKLIDFNAAKEFTVGKTEDTEFIGTHDYAAPEQYGFGQSDARTDIYALGVTMNYLLSGMLPREKIFSGSLKEVIEKCIKLDASNRYQDVAELSSAITSHTMSEYIVVHKSQERKLSKGLYERRDYLPIGFRTGYIWKMLIAVLGYWTLAYICLGMTFANEDGIEIVGWSLWVNRWGILILFLGYLFFMANYLDIRRRTLSIVKNRILKVLLGISILVLYTLLVIMAVIVLE